MPGSPYINIEHKSHPVSRLRIYISPETIRYGDQVSTFGNLRDLQFQFLKNLKGRPESVVLQRISASSSSPLVMRFTSCPLAYTENVEIHMRGTHQTFSSVEHVGAIGANLIASAENSSRSTVYESETLSRWR